MKKRRTGQTGLAAQRFWQRFTEDHALLESHKVTSEELQLLRAVWLFGKLESVDDILFILKNIRGDSQADRPKE